MLTELFIRDLAIIEKLSLDFADGLTVLTGETGAGKSIVLDALKLATGERADSDLVRHGADRAEVVARFEVPPEAFEEAPEGELLLRRVVSAGGGSRAYLNDAPCAVGHLRAIGGRLLEIHGQHEHYHLTRPDAQLALLDLATGCPELVGAVAELAGRWREAVEALATLRRDASLSEAERELVAYQVEELAPELDAAGAVEKLHEEHRRIAARQDLLAIVGEARDVLGGAVGDRLGEVGQRLAQGARLDDALEESRELVEAALISVQEAEQALNRYGRDLEDSESSLADVEARLERLHDLARKHRVDVTALPGRHAELEARLLAAAGAQEEEQRLEAKAGALAAEWRAQAERLGRERRRAARRLSERVSALMRELGMEEGRFRIDVAAVDDRSPRPAGQERVLFQVSANAGQPLKPLGRVASGGELSRIGLALRVALADDGGPGTLIFDEVDSGIGGRVAAIVGDRLRALADGRQVLCVTHLAQVASRGHRHFRVEKGRRGAGTLARVRALDQAARIDEIARMLGGREITDRTLAHARELLELAP